jgi:hypothetical protein
VKIQIWQDILGAFAKLRKTTISLIMSVCLPVSLPVLLSAKDYLTLTGQILKQFDI